MSKGLIMGSSISPLAADMFMDYLEGVRIMSEHNPYRKFIEFYARYADDIIISFSGSEQDLLGLHDYLNSCHESIKFTLELECEGKLNYLDLTIERKGGSHSFSIYRKMSSTDILIPADSFHHYQYKLAGLRYMVDRLLTTPVSDQGYNAEVRNIKYFASRNGYDETVVDSLIYRRYKKKMEDFLNDKTPERKEEGFRVSLPYLGNVSERIGERLKRVGLKTAFKSTRPLRSYFPKIKDSVEDLDKSGVYRISCTSCNSSYVGQSGRKIRTRLKEHLTRNTEFFLHTERERHNKDEIFFELLHNLRKGRKLNLVEGLEIKIDRLEAGDLNLNKAGEGSLRLVTDAALRPVLGNRRKKKRLRASLL